MALSEFAIKYQRKREAVRQLVLLCLESRPLTDEELDQIIDEGNEVTSYLYERWLCSVSGAKMEKRYRARKAELNKLPDEELQRQLNSINAERGRILAEDIHDELEDLFFESPSIDSDTHIIGELLKERKSK